MPKQYLKPGSQSFHPSIGSNGIRFKADDQNLEPLVRYLHGIEPGQWVRMAIVAEWDSNGWYEVWADLDESGEMVRVLDRQHGIEFLDGRTQSAWGIGLYHQLSLFDGTVAGQPRREFVHTDYANAQITEFTP